MQIGSTELVLIILILVIAYGLARAESYSAANSTTRRERAPDREGDAGAADPCAVLGVSPQATPAEVTAAYRKMAQMYHPDKVAGLAPEYREIAEKRMKEINAAYDQLKDARL